jgi:hypothetical protein
VKHTLYGALRNHRRASGTSERLHSKETDEMIEFNAGQWPVTVIDAFVSHLQCLLSYSFNVICCTVTEKVILKISSTDHTITSAMVCQGVIPCSPISPVAGISSEALELYHVAHLRSPHLSIQVFVKTMRDLHRVNVLTSSSMVLHAKHIQIEFH